jgi:hypothetical protein
METIAASALNFLVDTVFSTKSELIPDVATILSNLSQHPAVAQQIFIKGGACSE